jgi:DNA-binding response OmpR family regulator
LKILLVGNDLGSCGVLAKQIEAAKHELIKVPICTQGLKRINSDHSIDAVIVDADSSEDCGLKLLRAIRQDQHLAYFPVVMAGDSFSEEIVVAYHNLAVNDILLYPIAQATLEAKLARIEREGKKTILIVDDEPFIAEVIAEMLESQRYRTIIADSGEQALQILKNRTVHALVTDIMMPHVTGIDLLKVVKSNYVHIPVIMITGHFGKYRPRDAMAMGADGFFAKPFHNTELIYTLRSLLEQYRPLQLSLSHQNSGAK